MTRRGWPLTDAESQLPLRGNYRTCLVCGYRFYGESMWLEDACRGCAGWAAEIMGLIPKGEGCPRCGSPDYQEILAGAPNLSVKYICQKCGMGRSPA